MSKLILNITDNAQEDIENIYLYSLQMWAESQATLYVDTINQTIRMLIENPYIGKAVDELNIGFRGFPANKHVIFYNITDNKIINIIRILHENANYKNHLN